jgi:hypothetical protein
MRAMTWKTTAVAVAVVLAALGFAAAPSASRSESSSAAAPCSTALATQLVNQHNLNHFALPNPVGQALCGPFTGPGSKAMAVTIQAPTCWGVQHWAVFALSGDAWRLVHEQPAYLFPPLVRVGNGIRETTAVHRPGDPRCLPSGGKRSRVWRWNGSRLMAGPWQQVGAPDLESRSFDSPSRNISCYMADSRGSSIVLCQSATPPQRVTLYASGRVTICRNPSPRDNVCDLGDRGENRFAILAYGRHATVGRFRCLSLATGVRCTLIRTGKGFVINRDGARRVG